MSNHFLSLHKRNRLAFSLRHMGKTDREFPDQQTHYANLLEDAYTALAEVETSVDELRQELEYHHKRLGKPIEPDDGEE